MAVVRDREVVIVGAGPAGTITALLLARRGVRPLLVERAPFPRYHIGESLSGEGGGVLRMLGVEEHMDIFPVKRGTAVIGSGAENSFFVPVMARTPEGALTPATTWQVRRSDFDNLLLERAREAGIEIVTGEAIAPICQGRAVTGVRVRAADGETDYSTRVLVDASGLSTFFAKHGVVGPKDRGDYANQTAVFSQFRGTVRLDDETFGDTFIYYQKKHHWAWFIPIDDETVSIGVVVPAGYVKERLSGGESMEAFLAREIRELNPALSAKVPDLTMYEPVRTASNYSYRIRRFSGPGYLCVGDSHCFVDPIFSFGLVAAQHESQFAAEAIADHLSGACPAGEDGFTGYEAMCNRGLDLVDVLVYTFWDQPFWFARMVHRHHREEFLDYFGGRIYYDPRGRKGQELMRRHWQERDSAAATPWQPSEQRSD